MKDKKNLFIVLGLIIVSIIGIVAISNRNREDDYYDGIEIPPRYNEEEMAAYQAYDEKTSAPVEEASESNYAEIIQDRFGLDIKLFEDTGYTLQKVSGSENYYYDSISLTYTKPNDGIDDYYTRDKGLIEAIKQTGGGVVYEENEGGFISGVPISSDNFTHIQSIVYYIWEGRTYRVTFYEYQQEDGSSQYLLYLTLEKEYTLEKVKSILYASYENYQELMKESFGISPIYTNGWEFEFITSQGEFDGTRLSFIVNAPDEQTEDSENIYYDEEEDVYYESEIDYEKWDNQALAFVKDYFNEISKVSNGEIFEASYKVEDDIWELITGERIVSADDLRFDDEDTCMFVYKWNGKTIQLSFRHDWYNSIDVDFICEDL
ncbi:hypothetical protein J6Z48_00225 [bacterium]|nr:hypothetical protein [bacterium]